MDEMKYEQLEKMLCRELEKIVDKGELSAGSLDIIDKLTHSLKNTYKIHMGESGGYSQAYDMYGEGYDNGRYSRNSYNRDSSYANRRGMHYVRGHYSRDDAKTKMIEHLEQAMDMADDDNARTLSEEPLKRLTVHNGF